MTEKDIASLAHTKWRCQYHVVFAPKYRRMIVYGRLKKDVGEILRKLCEYSFCQGRMSNSYNAFILSGSNTPPLAAQPSI